MVHFQFLIEDISGQIFIEHVMQKLIEQQYDFTYDCKSFKGLGGLKISGNISKVKTDKLLNDLLIYLRGFNKSLQGMSSAIVVVLDNDNRNTEEFRRQLENHVQLSMIEVECIICIAVEEMEAWLLGDRQALLKAYPDMRSSLLKEYSQDSICGTWEMLANAVYKGGIKKFKKDCPTYREVGKYKSEWAHKVGENINIDKNMSPSFNTFISELKRYLIVA